MSTPSFAARGLPLREIALRFGFLVVFALFFAFFATWNPVFVQGQNLLNIVQNSSVLLILALGMTLIVATGGIDLSIGIALDFGAAFAVVAMKDFGADWPTACLAGLIGGSIVGIFNAVLVVALRVSPFMATLCTFFIGSSVQRIFTNGGGPISYRQMPEGFRALAMGREFGIPTMVLVALALLVVYYILLERSTLGRRIHAIGMQRSAATVAGIRVNAILVFCFVAAAVTCAVAGLISAASIRMFTPLSGFSYLMDAIAAVFIGAALHPRGRPNVPGTLVGVLFLGMVQNGLNLMGLDFNTKDALSGIILVAALTLAVLQRRMQG